MHEVRLKANDDGTWDIVTDDGVGAQVLATLAIVGGPSNNLSIDVRPAPAVGRWFRVLVGTR